MCWCCFFRVKTSDEMRISDWSSDVCSSDLIWGAAVQLRSAAERLWRKENWQKRWTGSSLRLKQWVYRRGSALAFAARGAAFAAHLPDRPCQGLPGRREIGRAVCRERGGQARWIWGCAGDLKKNKKTN